MSREGNAVLRLKAAVGCNDDTIARIAAPLWARVGRAIKEEDLHWSTGIGGDRMPCLLWDALEQSGSLVGEPPKLLARGVAALISALIGEQCDHPHGETPSISKLQWTLPRRFPGAELLGTGLKDSLLRLIGSTQSELVLVAPYIDQHGVGELLEALLGAFGRGIKVLILTHDALNLASLTSRGLEVLRREAERVGGCLTVYSGENAIGPDRLIYPLLHAKLFIGDRSQLLVGSANLTSYAFSSNFEVATLLGAEHAESAYQMVKKLIEAKLAYLVFSIEPQLR